MRRTIERHERRQVGVVDGTTISTPHDGREDRLCAAFRLRADGRLLGSRPADEDAIAARRAPGALRVVRTGDLDAAQVRPEAPLGNVEAARKRPKKRLALPSGERSGFIEERD